jgi:hypothetical protein
MEHEPAYSFSPGYPTSFINTTEISYLFHSFSKAELKTGFDLVPILETAKHIKRKYT